MFFVGEAGGTCDSVSLTEQGDCDESCHIKRKVALVVCRIVFSAVTNNGSTIYPLPHDGSSAGSQPGGFHLAFWTEIS